MERTWKSEDERWATPKQGGLHISPPDLCLPENCQPSDSAGGGSLPQDSGREENANNWRGSVTDQISINKYIVQLNSVLQRICRPKQLKRKTYKQMLKNLC